MPRIVALEYRCVDHLCATFLVSDVAEYSVSSVVRLVFRTIPMAADHQTQIVSIVHATPWLMRALQAVRDLMLPVWCIGAGALRNATWDALQGYTQPSALADIDVAYFDPLDLSRERDVQLQNRLERAHPDLPWEVTNQAGVHLWFEETFGHAVEPLPSIEAAVASWPETATSVAVRLDCHGNIEVIAPLGLADLFAMIVRRNPRRVSVATYRRRIAEKCYTDRWPRVRVIPE
jgi:hypothetical protein